MDWIVEYHPDYLAELQNERDIVRVAIISAAGLLKNSGPHLKRPYTDTLNGSAYSNMKELRITVLDGEWRIAYAFDPARQAILLTGASKSGVNEKKFYQRLIRIADRRYADHLSNLKKGK